jgi:hypothetical protein
MGEMKVSLYTSVCPLATLLMLFLAGCDSGKKIPDITAEKVNGWITNLGDKDWKVRRESESRLIAASQRSVDIAVIQFAIRGT